ncbi:MAG: hypothetical protein U0Q55_16970 [Vicinamibacterales bacterium]
MAVDFRSLWDFSNPALSEARFRAELATAQGDDSLILRTQIARTFGLRRDFEQARTELALVAANLDAAGGEARARYHLELGRTYASATHPPETQTEETASIARREYHRAWEVAQSAGLDNLVIDAIHMLAFVDPAPADQVKWAEAALAVSTASSQPDARRWEAPLRHNLGYGLHQLGRFDDALVQFEAAVRLRTEGGADAAGTRVGRWMVAWTLRALNRLDEALALQLALEAECDAAGAPDPYVFEELEHLYRARGDDSRAAGYAARRAAVTGATA